MPKPFKMNNSSIFKFKTSGSQTFILVFLVLVLIGLVERVLYDLSRTVIGTTYSYINDLPTLLLHTIFAIVIIVVAVTVNVAVSEKKDKYAMILIPYFVTAIALGLQVAVEAAIYFANHHTPVQFYLVMSSLVIIPSVLIYLIQKRYIPLEPSEESDSNSLWWSPWRILVGIILLLVVLYFASYLLFFWGGGW